VVEPSAEYGILNPTYVTVGTTGSMIEPIPDIDEIPQESALVLFGQTPDDTVELHIININDILLESFYKIPFSNQEGFGTSKNTINNVRVEVQKLFRQFGYISGKFKFQLNFHRGYLGNFRNPITITSINDDRTQITVSFAAGSPFNNLINAPLVDQLGNRLEYYLNLGNLELYRIASFSRDNTLSTTELDVFTVNLQLPLPDSFNVSSESWIDLQLLDPATDTIIIYPKKKKDPINVLRYANFATNVNNNIGQSTGYKTWNTILGSNPTSSQQLINTFISNSFNPIELNVNYRDYSNFIFYSSATERLKNFRYKLQLIEYYDGLLSSLNSVSSPGSESLNNVIDVNTKKNAILAGFDGYEKYLYYQSSSYETSSYGEYWPDTWPKSNSSKPYTLYSVSSTEGQEWYAGQLVSASDYDSQNVNRLTELMPSFMRESDYYDAFEVYINMLAQHFDILWLYVTRMTDVNSRKESVYEGLSKDLVYHVLRSLGIEGADGYSLSELWLNELGVNASGSFRQSGSLESIPNDRITKETFKRILNNLPYLLKTKGTERGIRALLNCYGVPSTILRVKEFSGPYDYKSTRIDTRNKYKRINKFTLATYFSASLNNYITATISPAPSTVQFRFKPENSAALTQSLMDGASELRIWPDSTTASWGYIKYGTGATIKGPFYNGKWNNVTINGSKLYVIQTSGDSVAMFTGSATLGSATAYSFGEAVGSNQYFTGSMQEIRAWNVNLDDETVKLHALNPQSIAGTGSVSSFINADWRSFNNYDYQSSWNQLIARYPLGTTLQTFSGSTSTIQSIHPNQSQSRTATAFAFTTNSFVGNDEFYYVWSPNFGDSSEPSNKIRIESTKVEGQLNSTTSVEKSQYDSYQFDSPKLGVYFSPQDEINEDIADQFPGLLLDDFIGDPRDDYEPRYRDLEKLRNHYNRKYTDNNAIWKYNRLIENFDASMFYLIKKFLPARAVKMVGLVIQPTLLDRPKAAARNVFIDPVTYDATITQSLEELEGVYNTYQDDINNRTVFAKGDIDASLSSDITGLSNINLLGDYVEYLAAIQFTVEYLQTDGYQESSYIHDNTPTRFYGAGQRNHSFLGCRISSPGFNIPSPDTYDGKPVIEIWSTSPIQATNLINPNGLINL